MKKLAKSVYYHTTADGLNVGCVIGEDAVVCIDLPLDPAEAREWRVQIGTLSDRPIRAVIFTASDRLRAESLAAVNASTVVLHNTAFAHAPVPSEQLVAQPSDLLPTPSMHGLSGTPCITLSDSMSIVLGVKQALFVDAVFQGGYSPDACFVALRDSGIVFAGDHVAFGQPPNLSQGNFERWQAILNALRKNRTIATVVPGRGPASSPVEVADATLDYIKAASVRVRALVRANRSRGEVSALVPDLMAIYAPKIARSKSSLAYEALGQEMRAGLERLYDELQRKGE